MSGYRQTSSMRVPSVLVDNGIRACNLHVRDSSSSTSCSNSDTRGRGERGHMAIYWHPVYIRRWRNCCLVFLPRSQDDTSRNMALCGFHFKSHCQRWNRHIVMVNLRGAVAKWERPTYLHPQPEVKTRGRTSIFDIFLTYTSLTRDVHSSVQVDSWASLELQVVSTPVGTVRVDERVKNHSIP